MSGAGGSGDVDVPKACYCAEARAFIGSHAHAHHEADTECRCTLLASAGASSAASRAYASALGDAQTAGQEPAKASAAALAAASAAPGVTLLARNCRALCTMDDAGTELLDGDACIFCRGGVIVAVGPESSMPEEALRADVVLDLSNHVVLPGLVNTHHHMYQSLTRCFAQDKSLFDWLKALYPVWSNITPEMVRVSAATVMAEMALTGCTTASDHLYIFPNGVRLEDECDAAAQIGMRFHASRGAQSRGESDGGLPPDSLVEEEGAILADMRRSIEALHDPSRFSMRRVVLAPCSPFSVTDELMKAAAAEARRYPRVSLHTHLAENASDIDFSLSEYGVRPGAYAERVGWTGPDVWHAHCVKLDESEVSMFASTATGVAHCPSSNMRLASGVAPVREMLDAGVSVALGVDGSASNDGAHMMNEARMMLLLQRVSHAKGAEVMGAREALRVATRGGAQVLGRDDIGSLEPGMAADFIAYRLDDVALTGAQHDPIAALVLAMPDRVDVSVIDGRVVVKDGALQTADLPELVKKHNELSEKLFTASGHTRPGLSGK